MEADAKLLKMWVITEINDGTDFDIKKLADSNHEIVEYNSETSKITIKNGKQIQVFKTFKEAALVTIGKKISKKKEIWEKLVEDSYKINEEIGRLLDSQDKLRGTAE